MPLSLIVRQEHSGSPRGLVYKVIVFYQLIEATKNNGVWMLIPFCLNFKVCYRKAFCENFSTFFSKWARGLFFLKRVRTKRMFTGVYTDCFVHSLTWNRSFLCKVAASSPYLTFCSVLGSFKRSLYALMLIFHKERSIMWIQSITSNSCKCRCV